MKVDGKYDWFKYSTDKEDGCSVWNYRLEKVHNIIKNNRGNQSPKKYSCPNCKCIDALTGSYIAFVEEDTFINNPKKYIDNAYDKSENDAAGYEIDPTR